jgi:hypothetical protein
MRAVRARRAEIRLVSSAGREVRPRGQARHPHARCQGSLSRRVDDRHTNGRTAAEAAACGSGGELLATARAASRDHLAAADRRRTSAKAMAALAHQLAGLIGPLHGLGLRIPIVGGKIERRPILNAQTLAAPLRSMLPSDEPENECGASAPLQGRAYAAPTRASQSPAVRDFTAESSPSGRNRDAPNQGSSAFCAAGRGN